MRCYSLTCGNWRPSRAAVSVSSPFPPHVPPPPRRERDRSLNHGRRTEDACRRRPVTRERLLGMSAIFGDVIDGRWLTSTMTSVSYCTMTVRRPSFIIRHYFFTIRPPSFTICHFSFIIRPPSFISHHPSFIIRQHSYSFGLHRSPFVTIRSSFAPHSSSFVTHRSPFVHHAPLIARHSSPIVHHSLLFVHHSSLMAHHSSPIVHHS